MGQVERRKLLLGLAATSFACAFFAGAPDAHADPPPKAEVLVIHATKCANKSIDPKIGDAPPSLGYECLKLLDKKTLTLPPNQPMTMSLPNGRTFQLLHTGKDGARFKITASINAADNAQSFAKLADFTADANKPFNVGGFSYQGGVLVLTVRILP